MPTLPLGAQGVGVGLPPSGNLTTTPGVKGTYPRLRAQGFIRPATLSSGVATADNIWQTSPIGAAAGANLTAKTYQSLACYGVTSIDLPGVDYGKLPSMIYLKSAGKFIMTGGSTEAGDTAIDVRTYSLDATTATWTTGALLLVNATAGRYNATFMPLRTSQADPSTKLCVVATPFGWDSANIPTGGALRVAQILSNGNVVTPYTALVGDNTVTSATVQESYFDNQRFTYISRGYGGGGQPSTNAYEIFATNNTLTLSTGGGAAYITGLRNQTRYTEMVHRGNSVNTYSILPYSNWYGVQTDYHALDFLMLNAGDMLRVNSGIGTPYASLSTFSSSIVAFNECDGTGVGTITYMRISSLDLAPFQIQFGSTTSFSEYVTAGAPATYLVEVFSDATGSSMVDSYVLRAPNPVSMGDRTKSDLSNRHSNAIPLFIATEAKKVVWMWVASLISGSGTGEPNTSPYFAISNLGD